MTTPVDTSIFRVGLELCDELIHLEIERPRSCMGPTPTTVVEFEWHEALELSRALAYSLDRGTDQLFRLTLPFGMKMIVSRSQAEDIRRGLRRALGPKRG